MVVKSGFGRHVGDTVAQRVQGGKVRMKSSVGDDSVSSGVSRENNVCNGALHVIGLYGPGDKDDLPFLGGLGACDGGTKLSHCPGHVVPGNA